MRISELKNESISLGIVSVDVARDIIARMGIDLATVKNIYEYEGTREALRNKMYLRRINNNPSEKLCLSYNKVGEETENFRVLGLCEIAEYQDLYRPIKGYRLNKYYVMKIGGTAPKHPHDTYKAAMAEAKRLQAIEGAANFVIFNCKGVLATEVVVTEHNG